MSAPLWPVRDRSTSSSPLVGYLLAVAGRNSPGGRGPRAGGHDEAAGTAAPHPVRCLVPGAAWLARNPAPQPRSARPRSSWSGCRSSRPEARRVTCGASSSTRTSCSRSCRCEPGTCGGWSRGSSAATTSSPTRIGFLGPLTFRDVGFLATAAGELAVFVAVLRSPSPRTLALGITAAALVAFSLLTTMHERYAYAALVFLALLIPERRFLAIWIAFGVVFTLNLLAAVPPTAVDRRAAAGRGTAGDRGLSRDDGDHDCCSPCTPDGADQPIQRSRRVRLARWLNRRRATCVHSSGATPDFSPCRISRECASRSPTT